MNLLHLYYLDPSKQAAVSELFRRVGVSVCFERGGMNPSEVDILLIGAHELNAADLGLFPRLRFIQVLGKDGGLIDREYCEQHGIIVSETSAPKGHVIAEHAIGMALYGLRQFSLADQKVRQGAGRGGFEEVDATETHGCDNWPGIASRCLYGSEVGIVGMGAVGLELLKRLRAFDCSVHYYKRARYSHAAEKRLGLSFLDIDAILSRCEVLFFQLPATDQTVGMISADRMMALQPGCVVVNCGRASVFDEAAMIDALQQKRIGFAGLDVFWREPLPSGHPLCAMDHVLLTPHMAEQLSDGPDVSQLRQEAMQCILRWASQQGADSSAY